MQIYKYETPIEIIKNLVHESRLSIFLAGPTSRPNQSHIPSWRIEAIEEFKRQNFDGILIIPEFENKGEYRKDLPILMMWNKDDNKLDYNIYKEFIKTFEKNGNDYKFYSYDTGGHDFNYDFIEKDNSIHARMRYWTKFKLIK